MENRTSITRASAKAPKHKGMSMDRVRYNTDLVFSIAKRTGLSLQDVIDRIYREGEGTAFDNAYSKRKRIGFEQMVEELSNNIICIEG